eukprot:PhF_6_TR33567/c0_g1_i2/m.48974
MGTGRKVVAQHVSHTPQHSNSSPAPTNTSGTENSHGGTPGLLHDDRSGSFHLGPTTPRSIRSVGSFRASPSPSPPPMMRGIAQTGGGNSFHGSPHRSGGGEGLFSILRKPAMTGGGNNGSNLIYGDDIVVVRAEAYDSGSDGDGVDGQPWQAVDSEVEDDTDDSEVVGKLQRPVSHIVTSSATQTVDNEPLVKVRTTGCQHDAPDTRHFGMSTDEEIGRVVSNASTQYDPGMWRPISFTLGTQTHSPPRTYVKSTASGPDPNPHGFSIRSFTMAVEDTYDICEGEWAETEPPPPPPKEQGMQTAAEMQFVHLAVPERRGLRVVPPQYFAEQNDWFEQETRKCIMDL